MECCGGEFVTPPPADVSYYIGDGCFFAFCHDPPCTHTGRPSQLLILKKVSLSFQTGERHHAATAAAASGSEGANGFDPHPPVALSHTLVLPSISWLFRSPPHL